MDAKDLLLQLASNVRNVESAEVLPLLIPMASALSIANVTPPLTTAFFERHFDC